MPNENPICPFCQSPMTKGILSTHGDVQWFDGKPGFFQELFSGGDILTNEVDLIRGTYLNGWRCNSCFKLLLDYQVPSASHQ